MRWRPYSYNGTVIHDGTAWAAKSLMGGGDLLNMPGGDAVFTSRGLNANPKYSGIDRRPREFMVSVTRVNATEALFSSMIQTLKGVFYPESGAQGTLIVQDLEDSNKQYYITCIPTSAEVAYPSMMIYFAADDPRLYANTAGTTSGTITASGGTMTVAIGGNVNSQPIIKVIPTQAKTNDYAYKMPVVTYNMTDTALTEYPVEIATNTSGTVWSTTAAVSGGTIQADGDDVRVFDNGVEVDRWLSGMNSGTTKVWCNLSYAPYTGLIVGTAVSASGTPAAIYFKHTAANKNGLKGMPDAGELYNPATGERIMYSAKDSWTVTPSYRGTKGTTAGTIAAGGTLIWLDHDLWIYYGNSGAEAPVTDDTKKPIINLANSTNVSWDYDEFWSDAGTRAGEWKPAIVHASSTPTQRQTKTYSGGTVTETDPATHAGLAIMAYQKGGSWKAEDALLEARWYNPIGGTAITVIGEKYRVSTSWPDTMGIQRSERGTKWANVFDEATPGSATAWTNLTANGSVYALGGTFPHLRLAADGAVAGATDNAAYIEISDATISLDGNNTPRIIRGAIQNNYHAAPTLRNTVTGHEVSLEALMAVGGTITIDCQTQAVTYEADGTDLSPGLVTNTARLEWLDLRPGTNPITYTDAGMGTVVVRVIARDEMV